MDTSEMNLPESVSRVLASFVEAARSALGDVGHDGHGDDLARDPLEVGTRSADDRDAHSFFGETSGDDRADAAGTARDQRDTSGKGHRVGA